VLNISRKRGDNWSLKTILVLFLLLAIFGAFSFIQNDNMDNVDVKRIAKHEMGATVLAGDDVINENNINKYPIASNLPYLVYQIKIIDILGIIQAITTGAVPLPISEFTKYGISDAGEAEGFIGPGILTAEDNRLVVKPPDNFVWGYKTPYTFGVKTENGLNIVENNEIIQSISVNNINNNTIPNKYLSGEDVNKWFDRSDFGDNITLDYGLSHFSDNRTTIAPNDIEHFFGIGVVNYTQIYPNGSPVMVYMANYEEKIVSDSYTYLGSYPQYNDNNRAYNAKQFAIAWNGTIIPPNSTSSGTEIIGFVSSADPKAPGGYAAHGVCPPARTLRAIAMSLGFPLPQGMNTGSEAVNFGVNPGSGIKVTNTGNVPVKIIMWTEGEGPNMIIYAKMIEFIPEGYDLGNGTNSDNNI